MRLELVLPPRLVSVAERHALSPALLIATRGTRSYVQVSRGPGLNVLRWVDSACLRAADVAASARRDQQALRADADRPVEVVQHRGRQPRAVR